MYSGTNYTAQLVNYAWYSANASGTTHTVGTKTADELGLFDMSGNVWEWTWNINTSYPSGAQTNPHGAVSGSYRVFRSGSWQLIADFCTVSSRNFNTATTKAGDFGFRCVRIAP